MGGCIPNYSAHTATNCVLVVPLLCFGLYGQDTMSPRAIGVSFIGFLIATFLLSPDLDLRNSTPTRNWGVFKFVWFGYSKVFRHRGQSHSFIFSRMTKLAYLVLIGLFFSMVVEVFLNMASEKVFGDAFVCAWDTVFLFIHDNVIYLIRYKEDIFAAMFGIVLSDWIHICSDRLYSKIKN